MILQAFHNNSEKKKTNFKERLKVAQIRHTEEDRGSSEMGKKGLRRR